MPRTAWLRRRRVWTAGALLLSTMAPAPSSAYVFTLVGDGDRQLMTWYWATATYSCVGHNPPCGNVLSLNGEIPLQAVGLGAGAKEGGMLDLTLQPGSVKAVAMPIVWQYYAGTGIIEAWVAVSAREDIAGGLVPLEFRLDLEPGDPLVADLLILPRLVGTAYAYTFPGGLASLQVQFDMSVSINSQVVTSDALYTTFEVSNGDDGAWALSLPNGPANSVLIPGVGVGSTVVISLWAYMRGYVQGAGTQTYQFSPYGDGPALEVIVRDANQVDVTDADSRAGLELGIAPNPTRGTTRLRYSLARAVQVRLSIYDVSGRRVATPLDRLEEAGRHELAWDGRDERGRVAPPGVYAVELVAGPERIVRRVVMLGR